MAKGSPSLYRFSYMADWCGGIANPHDWKSCNRCDLSAESIKSPEIQANALSNGYFPLSFALQSNSLSKSNAIFPYPSLLFPQFRTSCFLFEAILLV